MIKKKLFYLNISDSMHPWFDTWMDQCPEDVEFDDWIYESLDENRGRSDYYLFTLTQDKVEELIQILQKLLKEHGESQS
jgi:hypothetical protein